MTVLQTRRELISLADAADYLGVSIKTIRRRVAAGELRAYRLSSSRVLRINLAELDALMRPIPTAGGDAE